MGTSAASCRLSSAFWICVELDSTTACSNSRIVCAVSASRKFAARAGAPKRQGPAGPTSAIRQASCIKDSGRLADPQWLQGKKLQRSFLNAESESILAVARTLINQGGFLDDVWLKGQCRYSGYSILSNAHQILLATPVAVLQGLIRGDLPAMSMNSDLQYLQSPQYVQVTPTLNTDDIVHPVIYAVYLVDSQTNMPPTIRDVKIVLDNIEASIDTLNMPTQSKARAKSLASLLKDRILGHSPNSTLAGGLVNIGFAGKGSARLAQHVAGVNSNEIMQLFRESAQAVNRNYNLQGMPDNEDDELAALDDDDAEDDEIEAVDNNDNDEIEDDDDDLPLLPTLTADMDQPTGADTQKATRKESLYNRIYREARSLRSSLQAVMLSDRRETLHHPKAQRLQGSLTTQQKTALFAWRPKQPVFGLASSHQRSKSQPHTPLMRSSQRPMRNQVAADQQLLQDQQSQPQQSQLDQQQLNQQQMQDDQQQPDQQSLQDQLQDQMQTQLQDQQPEPPRIRPPTPKYKDPYYQSHVDTAFKGFHDATKKICEIIGYRYADGAIEDARYQMQYLRGLFEDVIACEEANFARREDTFE
ncbi:hypothetical protein V493_01706 [Pseudogymnoascus sp. VKM F-4281 (FW-2241)]|nr:hypothetical protein V493_01706 [Pseudogymnoascus sp. VKM F-4281 (FW-2241)]